MINKLLSKPLYAATLIGLVVGSLLSAFLVAKIVSEVMFWDTDSYLQNTITVSGEGESIAIPNVTKFSFSVNESAETTEEAQKMSTEKMDKALSFLKSNGIEERDIKTTSYDTYPKYDYGRPCTAFDCPPTSEPKIIGYEVSQSVSVKVRQQEEAGRFLAELGSIGVSNLSGLSFEIDDDSILYEQAREKAIEDAKNNAQKLAKQLGVKLGDIVSFDESTPNNYMFDYRALNSKTEEGGFGGGIPELPTGENTYTSNVHITYGID